MMGANPDFETYKFDQLTGIEREECIVCGEVLYAGPKKGLKEKMYDGDLTCKVCGTNNW